jgi:hypothetical protein
MMKRVRFVRKCRFALIAIALRYFVYALTLDAIDAITIDAILN